MMKQIPCSYLTRRGKPCRNPAQPGSNPAACHVHQQTADQTHPLPTAADHPYPKLSRSLYESNDTRSLIPELTLVRHTLYLLNTYLDNKDCALEPRELRQLAQVIFSGARTAAALLLQEGRKGNGLETWFTQALDQLAREYDLEQ